MMSKPDEEVWFRKYAKDLRESLAKSKNLYDVIEHVQRVLRSDLVTGLLINRKGIIEVLFDKPRPIKPRFDSFYKWFRELPSDGKSAVVDAMINASPRGRYFEVMENHPPRMPLRPTLSIIQLQTIDFQFDQQEFQLDKQDHIKCIITILFEDFWDVFNPIDPIDQVASVATSLNNWIYRQDSKAAIGSGNELIYRSRRSMIFDALVIDSEACIPLELKSFANNLVGKTAHWWDHRIKDEVDNALWDVFAEGWEEWGGKYFASRFDLNDQTESSTSKMIIRYWLISFWAWWRSLGQGQLGQHLYPVSHPPQDSDHEHISKGLRVLPVAELVFRCTLTEEFNSVSTEEE
jgi:hypothetical protein